MIREPARIVSIRSSQMVVQPLGSAGCSACAGAAACGSRKLARLLPQARREFVLPLQAGRRVGDVVDLVLPESSLLTAACHAYLPPLAGLVLGALAISPAGEPLQPLGAILGMLSGFALSRLLARLDAVRMTPQAVPADSPIPIAPQESQP